MKNEKPKYKSNIEKNTERPGKQGAVLSVDKGARHGGQKGPLLKTMRPGMG